VLFVSQVKTESPTLHEGLADNFAPAVLVADTAVAPVGRDVVVTPHQNPGTVNMLGSVMGSHMVRPMGTKRAKAAAKLGTPSSSVGGEPAPPQFSVAALAAEKLTNTLGKIFGRAKKKVSFKMKAKIWEAMVFYKKHASARKLAEELWSYNIDDEEEALQEEEEEKVDDDEEEEEDGQSEDDEYQPFDEDEDEVQQVDSPVEHDDVEVVRIVVGEGISANTTQDTSDNTTVVGIVARTLPERGMRRKKKLPQSISLMTAVTVVGA
jgi:hypothetical protein